MRVVSYNIMKGGEGRADPLAEVLLAQRADVVGLVEAVDGTVLERIAGRLGMDYIRAEGRGGAVALLSRWPIVATINHGPLVEALAGGLVEAVVRADAGEVTVGVVQLAAADAAGRDAEIEAVVQVFEPHRRQGRGHVLVGSFETPDGQQAEQAAVERIQRAGYVDALAGVAAQADGGGTFPTQRPDQRPDFILVHGDANVKIASAWIERDRLARYASDHFPVGAEIE